MASLPTPGELNWNVDLDAFLLTAHNADGTLGTVGSGDAQSLYNATTAQLLPIKKGTAASPDTSVHPLLKVERLLQVNESAITGDGFEQLSSVLGIAVGTAGCETQPVGVAGAAKTSSTVSAPGNDACGLYGAGYTTGSATGVGIGAFLSGRNDSASGKCQALELSCYNGTGSDQTYSSGGFQTSQALWLTSGGNRSAAGIVFGKPAGRTTFETGIAFNAQNPVLTTSIRDDGNATTSIAINGTHTNAITIASGAGHVGIGATPLSTADVFIQTEADNVSPLVVRQFSGTQTAHLFAVQNAGGGATYFSIGGTGEVSILDGKNVALGTTTGTKFGTATAQKLAFHNSTPVIQRAGAAQVAVAATGATSTTPFGYTTAAQADAIVTLVNEIRATLVEKGLMKGAA